MLGMFGKLVLLLATMTVAIVLPTAPGVAADPYQPAVDTQVHVSVKAVQKVDVKVRIGLRVSVNGTVEPTGEITVKVRKVAGSSAGRSAPQALASTVWSTTVRYEGDPVRVTSPGFAEGSYVVDAVFRPDSDQLRSSRASDRFVVEDRGRADQASDEDSADGALPDTGGPNGWWLLAGLALVGVGAGALVLARRRSGAAAPAVGSAPGSSSA